MWKTIRGRGNNLIFQRQELPHHVITVYEGDYNTWWPINTYNINYEIKMGSSIRNVVKDLIVLDLTEVNNVVNTIKKMSEDSDLANMEKSLTQKHESIIAVGHGDYADKIKHGRLKPIVRPYQVMTDEDSTGTKLAQVIREIMKQ